MPARPPPPPRRRFPWRGEWIELHADGSWNFYRCVKCRRELKDDVGRETGLSPSCRNIDPQLAERVRENARKVDRVAWKREGWYYRFGERVKAEAETTIRARDQEELRSEDGQPT
jgi:hypothetical protein